MTFFDAYDKVKQDTLGSNFTITSVKEADQFHDRFIAFRTGLFFGNIIDAMPHYRGEQRFGWDITPGIFRPPLVVSSAEEGKKLEEKAVVEFERVIKENVGQDTLRTIYNGFKYGREWDLLFQAQHAGIKTTLTDWSAYISSALFFATEESAIPEIENSDGQLWCLMAPTEKIMNDRIYELNPFQMNDTYLINPSSYITDIEKRIFEYRMYHQKGRFIIPSNDQCNIPLNHQDGIKEFLVHLTIPASKKKKIREELANRNVTREYFFVDENPVQQDLIASINQTIFSTTIAVV